MSVSKWRNWLCGGSLLALVGCQSLFGPKGPPQDPLFLSKTPMTAKAVYGPPVSFAYLEPSLPRDPYFARNLPALVEHDGPRDLAPPHAFPSHLEDERSVPGILTNRPIQRK